MDELVENHNVVLAEQRANRADGRCVTAGKCKRSLGFFESGERLIKFVKRRERAANQSRSARARAEFFNGFDRRFLQKRVVRKAEIIVGREIEKSFAAYFDPWRLRRVHAAQFAEQILFAQRIQPLLQFQIKIVHGGVSPLPLTMLAETVDA